MRIAIVVELGSPEYLDAQLAFHLNAGVDVVLTAGEVGNDRVSGILDPYIRQGLVTRTGVKNGLSAAERRDAVGRIAATEHGAEWLIDSAASEFWWPRGEGLKDVLIAVPPRYGMVQALVRDFLPRAGTGSFAERMTKRTSLVNAYPGEAPRLQLLRPILRLTPGVGLHAGQPLRAWYPVEVLRFPAGAEATADTSDPLGRVVDERLRDALRVLGDGSSYALPAGGMTRLSFPVPSVVDDAEYAVECAAIGEVDLDKLDRHIRELEARIAWLEQRFWPRVLRRASHLLRGRLRPPG